MVVAHENQVAEGCDLTVVGVRLVARPDGEHAAAPYLHMLCRIAHVHFVNAILRTLEDVVILRTAIQLLIDHKTVVLRHEAAAIR